jgi:hypothetical protein
VSNAAYYLAWLAIALVLTGIASAQIARHLRWRELRRAKALELMEALEHYSMWVAAQRHASYFHGVADDDREFPLEHARSLVVGWFPEASEALLAAYAVHNRLLEFFWAQQVLRLRDPEGWLESDPERRFAPLWRQHRQALTRIAALLEAPAPGVAMPSRPASSKEARESIPA